MWLNDKGEKKEKGTPRKIMGNDNPRKQKMSMQSFEMSQSATSSMNSFSLNHMSSCSDSQHNANVKVTVHF